MTVSDMPFGPLSISSLLTTVGLLASIGAFIWKSGQWASQREEEKKAADLALSNHKTEVKTQIDGFGQRLSSVENEQLEARGRDAIMNENINRTLGAHESLIRIIGEARGSTVQCREDTHALGEKIEIKLEGMFKSQNQNHLELSTRLAGVEKELELMRHG
jgi:hypothetical protein